MKICKKRVFQHDVTLTLQRVERCVIAATTEVFETETNDLPLPILNMYEVKTADATDKKTGIEAEQHQGSTWLYQSRQGLTTSGASTPSNWMYQMLKLKFDPHD